MFSVVAAHERPHINRGNANMQPNGSHCSHVGIVTFSVITLTSKGLYCEAGDFYIDPQSSVERAVITHAHSDHARRGMKAYLCHTDSAQLLRHRLGRNISVTAVDYAHSVRMKDAIVTLFPSGHMLGAAQVRIEVNGEVWVVTGDYKRERDPLAADFDVVPCHTLITECTFGLPVYQWRSPSHVQAALNDWWQSNANNGVVSVVRAYSYGKAQRILLSLDTSIGPVFANQNVHDAHAAIRASGHILPPSPLLTRSIALQGFGSGGADLRRSLVIAAGGVDAALAGLPYAVADVSGWVLVRRFRRQTTNFPISDHADWPALLQTVHETGCERVFTMHGFTKPFARFLREQGLDAYALEVGGSENELPYAYGADWLRQVCLHHVGSEAETDALMDGRDYIPRSTLQKTRPQTSPTSGRIWTAGDAGVRVRCVLMHLHRAPGSRTIEKFTMGVWKDNVLVPLVDVGVDVTDTIMQQISSWANENTTTNVGHVQTIAPRFVFDVELFGASLAPRRKVGIRVQAARIIAFVGTNAHELATNIDTRALINV